MKLCKQGVLFFLVFVALTVVQRLIEGVAFSTGHATSAVVTGLIATGVFISLLRLIDR